MKRIMIVMVLILGVTILLVPAFADDYSAATTTAAKPAVATTSTSSGNYQENMKADLVRGFKNVIGSPLEVPITIQEYHEKAGRPVIRHVAGLIDGTFQGVMRAGSGLWDFVAAFLPGHQEGMPVDPETLF